MKKNNLFGIFAIAGACCLMSGANAQNTSLFGIPILAPAHIGAHVQENGPGREFMRKAAQGNIAEVRLGQLALKRSSNERVRRFAQTMVDDHRQALDEMKKYAANRNFDTHVGMGDEHRALYERLSRLSGRAFDRAYMRAMVQDHEKDVREWAAFANSGRSNEFHEWVSGKVPTLRHHLEMAREVWRDVRRAS